MAAPLPVLFVFSHLRWGFVFQRPQQILSRLAGRWRVVFVEEPVLADGPARLEVTMHGPHLEVLVPHTPVAAPGFHDDQIAMLVPLLTEHVRMQGLAGSVAWLYTPMALPLLEAVQPACVVYDCMDDLPSFLDAPKQLRQRESALMRRAALVMTGGPSLYESRRAQHPNVHCLPSSVDAAHFAPERLKPGSTHDLATQALQGHLPRPRVGYYGVIDERLDVSLVARLADARPSWSIVMAGPVAKIDPGALPQRPNLHWLGMQPYERLPYLLAGWDLALMPFALNEATRCISPTKTLEYMAGEKPVVSTAVPDVVALYGSVVAVAHGAGAFVDACDQVLGETRERRCRRAMEMLTTVSMHSWDRTADTVHRLVTEALSHARADAAASALRAPQSPPAERSSVPRVAAAGGRA
jgi:UDP-galactopyranose mutase